MSKARAPPAPGAPARRAMSPGPVKKPAFRPIEWLWVGSVRTPEARMLVWVGLAVVMVAVCGGYMSHGGKLLLLYQPSEFVIIGGAAIGILIASTPMAVLHALVAQIKRLMTKPPDRKEFADLLVMMYQLFRVAQSNGVMALEPHLDNPKESAIFSKYPKFLARHESVSFLADSARVIIVGGISPHDLESLMYEDLEIRHREALMPSATVAKVGDALPGLGIVAAVLGVVITMQAIGGPVEVIGHSVGAALVGTFLGILLSYGFAQPIAMAMEHRVVEEANIEQAIKAGVLAMHKGCAPAIAVEFARRIIPEEVRPSFEETEQLCRGARNNDAQMAA